jgi:hypothetical protein
VFGSNGAAIPRRAWAGLDPSVRENLRETITTSVTACRIERIIRKGHQRLQATFEVHLPHSPSGCHWIACSAAIGPSGCEPRICTAQRVLSPEQAAAMGVALGMANDWIAEASR